MDTPPRHQRVGGALFGVVLPVAQPPPHVEQIAEPLGGQQGRLGPVTGQNRVRGDGGAVHDDAHASEKIRHVVAQRGGDLLQPAHHADFGLLGRRRRLVDRERAVRTRHPEVGERAADVNADPVVHAPRTTATRMVGATSVVFEPAEGCRGVEGSKRPPRLPGLAPHPRPFDHRGPLVRSIRPARPRGRTSAGGEGDRPDHRRPLRAPAVPQRHVSGRRPACPPAA